MDIRISKEDIREFTSLLNGRRRIENTTCNATKQQIKRDLEPLEMKYQNRLKNEILEKMAENPQKALNDLKALCKSNITENKGNKDTPYSLLGNTHKNAILAINRLIKTFSESKNSNNSAGLVLEEKQGSDTTTHRQSNKEIQENCFQLCGLLQHLGVEVGRNVDSTLSRDMIDKVLNSVKLDNADSMQAFNKTCPQREFTQYKSIIDVKRFKAANKKLNEALKPFKNKLKGSELSDFNTNTNALLDIQPTETDDFDPTSDKNYNRLATIFELFTDLIKDTTTKEQRALIEKQLDSSYQECTSGPMKLSGLSAIVLGGLAVIAGLISLKVTWGLSLPASQKLIAYGTGAFLGGITLFCSRKSPTDTSRATMDFRKTLQQRSITALKP